MFEFLAEAIEKLELPIDGDSLTEVLALRDRLDAKIALAVGEFDKAALWDLDHASSMTAWLRTQAVMAGGAASALASTGRRLRDLPVVSAAWLDGSFSGGQVQAIVANLNDRVAPLFAEHEAELVPAFASLDVRQTALAMQAWRAKADAILDDTEPVEPESSLHLSRTFGGRGELKGSLDPVSTTIVDTALRLAASSDAEGERRSVGQQRADALVDVCRFFLDHQDGREGGRHRPHLNVLVALDDALGEGDGGGRALDGTVLSPEAIRVMVCDANIHRVVTDGRSTILDYGTATRVISPSLFTALVLRDGHCRHSGCDRPPQWCEGHHVIPVDARGPTNLANLVLKCSRHHHLAHKRGWRERLEPDGTYTITDPAGRTWTTIPDGALPLATAS